MSHSIADLDGNYHGNRWHFKAFGSALHYAFVAVSPYNIEYFILCSASDEGFAEILPPVCQHLARPLSS